MPRSGQAYAFNQAFRDAVDSELKQRGWSRAEFARQLHVSRGAVTQFFTTVKQTTLVPDICKLFGWDVETAITETVVASAERQKTGSQPRYLYVVVRGSVPVAAGTKADCCAFIATVLAEEVDEQPVSPSSFWLKRVTHLTHNGGNESK